jgi:hypothetical protein
VDFAATSPLAGEFRATWTTGRGFGFKGAEIPGETASEVEFRAEFAVESGTALGIEPESPLVLPLGTAFRIALEISLGTAFVTAVEIPVSVCCADRTVPFAVSDGTLFEFKTVGRLVFDSIPESPASLVPETGWLAAIVEAPADTDSAGSNRAGMRPGSGKGVGWATKTCCGPV